MKKLLCAFIIVITGLFLLVACAKTNTTQTTLPATMQTASDTNLSMDGTTAAKADYIKITPEEAKTLIDQGGVTILDVRTKEEFDQGHIKDAILLAAEDFEGQAATVLPNKDATILVYCRSGNRSKTATNLLIEMGYTKVMDFGGIVDWPYEVVT